MPCADLAFTGSGPQTLLWVAAAVLLLVGAVLVMRRRILIGLGVALLVIVAIAAGGLPGSVSPAEAASSCTAQAGNSLTITQTSTMSGLMPGGARAAITGLVTNNGPDDTDIADIVVSISSVTKAAGAVAGTCDASDYILLDPTMAVAARLGAGASIAFSGASIGFRTTAANQNACKGATVNLLYSTTP
jgi:hypothetical protein